jgi:hypothetical protein
VPSRQDGQLVVIGTDLHAGEPRPPADRIVKVEFACLAVEVPSAEKVADDQIVAIKGDPKKYRRWREGDPLEPGKLAIAREIRAFRRLEVGDEIKAGQILGLVDPTKANDEVTIKKARLEASEAERQASRQTKKETQRRYDSMVKSNVRVPVSISQDDLQGTLLSCHRYELEEAAKIQSVLLAKCELNQAQAALKMHEIRSALSGVVKEIYKHQGEGIKAGERVFQIQSAERLRLEGLVDAQHLPHLKAQKEVVVEPTRQVRPDRVLRGHFREVTGIAVSKGREPRIVSASEDGTVRVWDSVSERGRRVLRHATAVRSVACTSAGASKDWCLSGTASGAAFLWDLDNLNQPSRELAARHRDPSTPWPSARTAKRVPPAARTKRFVCGGPERESGSAASPPPTRPRFRRCTSRRLRSWFPPGATTLSGCGKWARTALLFLEPTLTAARAT